MLKDRIAKAIEEAVNEAQDKGLLPRLSLPEIILEHPQNPEHGDYACSLPLKLGRSALSDPMAIAKIIARMLPSMEEIDKVTVAAPGFMNFTLSPKWLSRQVEEVLKADQGYGNLDLGKGLKVQIEYVSVNPTGPLHVGHGRGAVLGSTLASVLSATGHEVEREYYVNDAGSQMDAFYRSLYARYCQALGRDEAMPANGYQGEYMVEFAHQIVAEMGGVFFVLSPDEAIQKLGAIGLEKMLAAIKSELERLRVGFDVWFSERSLFERSQYQRSMGLLREGGYIAEKEGAQWFVSTALGEDKDNVLVRSTGAPTYFASDVAYHYNKFVERGFDKVINIWGADHQGHVPRMKAVLAALGINSDKLTVIISQMVALRRGETVVRASKRTGEMVTLKELMDEVGPDACRFFFLSRSADAQMDFDLDLAKQQSADNPVYYVQYAHARIASILRNAEEKGIKPDGGDVSMLAGAAEQSLIRKMILLPELTELVSVTLEPHHLPYYAQDLATSFHAFYKQCRVISKNEELTRARLKLVKATRIVLARTLGLMGMTAPEKM